jgi:DNA-binding transcriptional LysR family regulator
MDFKLLETFKVVIETRSATQAAAMLGVTQPAISAQLGRLEDMLGLTLFDRTGGRLKPTTEGLSFYAEVAKALDNISHLEQAAENIRKGSLGRLVIASHPSAGISLLPGLISAFLKSHAGVSVRLITRNSEIVRSLFPSQLYDIGLTELPIDYRDIKAVKYRLPCVAVLPRGHALEAQKVITPAMLSGFPFFAISRERSSHHAIARAFTDAGAVFNLVGEAELFASICAVVAADGVVSVIDPWTADSFGLGVVVRPFVPIVSYEIAVFHSADRRPSTIASDFLALIDQRLRSLGSTPQRVRSVPTNMAHLPA